MSHLQFPLNHGMYELLEEKVVETAQMDIILMSLKITPTESTLEFSSTRFHFEAGVKVPNTGDDEIYFPSFIVLTNKIIA